MATAKLIPSSYSLSDACLSITNVNALYAGVDSDEYATVTNRSDSTAQCYLYIGGFDLASIPNDAIINSYTVLLKANVSGVSSSSAYQPVLMNGVKQIQCECPPLTSRVQVLAFSCHCTWWELEDLNIRINCRKSSRNNTGYVYIYGAEIIVEYTVPVYQTINSTINGLGTIYPVGTYSVYDGDIQSIMIVPNHAGANVSATKNGIDITPQLVPHGETYNLSAVLGKYTLVYGGFNTPDGIYFSGIEGHGSDATKTISNYRSSGIKTIFEYSLSFTGIPSNAIIERVYCEVNGHAENRSSACMSVRLKSGQTYLSDRIDFKMISTNNTIVVLEATPTIKQLEDMVLECEVGPFGGAINGASCYVLYQVMGDYPNYYTYVFKANGDTNITATIEAVSNDKISFKSNGVWIESAEVYKMVNGLWVKCDELIDVFNPDVNYVKGELNGSNNTRVDN